MSSGDATENLQQAPHDDDLLDSADPRFHDLTTEHIVIEDEFANPADDLKVVREREYLRNHVQRTITEITFYEEGFLKIREGNKKKLLKEHVLELRFIDPEPIMVRQIAMPWLWSSLALAVLASGAGVFLPATQIPQYAAPVAAILAALAILLFCVFVCRSKISHIFCTASGKTDVVSLCASIGCFREARNLAMQVRKAIERAGEDNGVHDVRYLRAEMQAHYRLAETGVITREECSDGTALILSKFG
ncbi:MAG: hypothetical protein IIB76_05790 [Proteobacteria bacterium]|nr:hypothetical protein [Pseudomonadota bacterium]